MTLAQQLICQVLRFWPVAILDPPPPGQCTHVGLTWVNDELAKGAHKILPAGSINAPCLLYQCRLLQMPRWAASRAHMCTQVWNHHGLFCSSTRWLQKSLLPPNKIVWHIMLSKNVSWCFYGPFLFCRLNKCDVKCKLSLFHICSLQLHSKGVILTLCTRLPACI